MALVNQDLVLDVVPGPIPPILHLTEYDENMEVVVTLQRRGQPFQIPTGTTAKVEGTIAGHPFSENGTPSGNTVTFMVSKSMTAYSGRAWTKIKLTQNNKPVSTCGFWLDCDRAGVEADTVIGASGFEEQIVDAVQDWLDEHPPASGGLTDDVKAALLDCFRSVAWLNDNDFSDKYTALYAAMYPPVDVLSISAVFTQGDAVIYDTDSLDTLRQYLVVTATMTDSTTRTVTDYTLSGTLTEGTSTITVSYGGKTDTFNVTVRSYLTGYTTVGNPTIDSSYRMTTSNGNFIKTPFNFDNGGKSWELRGKINFSAARQPIGYYYDVANFVDSSNNSTRGLLVELNRTSSSAESPYLNRFNIFASTGASSWDVVNPTTESILVGSLIDGDFYFKCGWTGSAYYIAASADGVTWSNELRHEWQSATSIMTGYPIAFGNKRNTAWGYCIYVNSLELDIDGSLYWKAVE